MNVKIPRTREEADALLKTLGQISISRARIEARMNERIQQAKDAATDALGDLPATQAAIQEALETYFLAERPKLGKRRSLKLTFGTIGLRARKALEFIRGWNEERVIAAIEGAGRFEFLRQRTLLNREAIHDASEDDQAALHQMGVRVEHGDTFYCTPDLQALAEVEKAS